MENVNQNPEVVADLTKEQLDKAIQTGEVATSPTPAPAPVSHLHMLLKAKWDAEHCLGTLIDIGSSNMINQRTMEYEVTVKQMAVSAALGNKEGFEQMVNQLQGIIYQNQLALVNMMRKIVEAKSAAMAREKKEEPSVANDAPLQGAPSVPAAPTEGENNASS